MPLVQKKLIIKMRGKWCLYTDEGGSMVEGAKWVE